MNRISLVVTFVMLAATAGCRRSASVDEVPVGSDVQLIVMGGLAGGLTTFSTFSVETVQLALAGRWRIVAATVGANLALGVAAAVLGFAIAGGFS